MGESSVLEGNILWCYLESFCVLSILPSIWNSNSHLKLPETHESFAPKLNGIEIPFGGKGEGEEGRGEGFENSVGTNNISSISCWKFLEIQPVFW